MYVLQEVLKNSVPIQPRTEIYIIFISSMVTIKNALCLLLIFFLTHYTESASIDAENNTKPDKVEGPPSVKVNCGRESDCEIDENTIPLCRYDEDEGCIRKYASKCHLDIAACKAGTKYPDHSNDYCSMETYLCEEGYERWTIFFGYEKV
ncbi:uncharacterized protein LOC105211153 [Zeugodacus cucurbitae]|uniref:uncharacterized protein LOC105211153 n=1 Tax=Zeugodacus cucurbitae TaxID=28588 RepID=UPI0010A75009|nr:uncharacterized protein LOC105211153 [Zeugodacus cucurbitae]